MIQYVIISIVLLVAVSYVVIRIYELVRKSGNPCWGCTGCALHDQMLKKKQECKKK